MSEAFWIDAELDRDKASDGVSRYGAYVRSRIPGGFSECWDGTFDCGLAERFAAMAWRTATAPVMAPPYVRRQPVVLSARIEVDAEVTSPLSGPWIWHRPGRRCLGPVATEYA